MLVQWGAAHRLDGDLALAVGTHLGGGLCGSFRLSRLLVQGVDELDDHEQHECYDEEVNDGIDEGTNADHHIAHMDADIREIGVEKQADGRVDDVVHQ